MTMKCCAWDIRIDGRLLRVARLYADSYKFLDDPEPVIEGLRICRQRIDLFTFMQKLPDTSPKYRYPMEWDNFAALPVSTYDAWWTQQINNKTRNMVRRAVKMGVELREMPFGDALVEGIWKIYNECPIRQGRPFRHYGKDIETVRREAATFLDSSIFIGAFLDDSLIGFAKLVIDETRTQAGVMHILSMIQQRDKASTNALIAQAVRSCAERGIPYLVYLNFLFRKDQRHSLHDFKVHNGFRRIDLPRYYVPLTRAGRIAFCLGLHHRFVDHFPESVLTQARKLRSAWYNRRYQTVTHAP